MQEKGFTLIELLAVIIVLGIVGVIVFPTVTKTMKNSKQKAYDTQITEIIKAAKIWGSKNTGELPDIGSSESVCITLDDLKEASLIDHGKIQDPRDSEKFIEGSIRISYSTEYHQYIYEYMENGC